MTACHPPTQLKILSFGSNRDSAWADIAIEGMQLTVTPQVAECLLQQYPTLARHACKSGKKSLSATFGDRLIGALLPHAVEHLAIELMVRAHPGEVFAGNTRWISREQQQMRVRVSLGQKSAPAEVQSAFSEAIEQLNGLLAMCRRQSDQKPLS